MIPPSTAKPRHVWILVVAQFVLAAYLVLTTRVERVALEQLRSIDVAAACLIGFGIAAAVWAWVTMGIFRIRVLPDPGSRAQLLTHGPYRLIRHPMYSGLLVATAGCLLLPLSAFRIIAWLILCIVLNAKAGVEEHLLEDRFAGYAAYRRRTRRFLPWIY